MSTFTSCARFDRPANSRAAMVMAQSADGPGPAAATQSTAYDK